MTCLFRINAISLHIHTILTIIQFYYKMRYILTISCLLISLWVFAQPVALPLTTNPVLQEYAKAHPEKAKPQLKSAPASLTLPFMDDFSYKGPYPETSLWMDNDVFVNNTLGMNPPSIGVATLDGLDATGLPYGDEEGWADTLTSQIIDLSGTTPSDGIILSFFVQPQGFGDAPESIDRLVLEFKKDSSEWVEVRTIAGDFVGDFEYISQPISSLYLGGDFQFRFLNFNARTGFVDLWHIDYVKMDKGRLEGSPVFEDVCFTEAPKSYLKELTAMPWAHYWENRFNLVNLNLIPNIRNHNDNSENISNINFKAEEVVSEVTILTRDMNNATIAPLSESEFDLYPLAEQNTGDLAIGSLSAGLPEAKIITEYYLTAPNQEVISNQENFNLTNDVVTRETTFSNYFSYDDGTAEYNIGLDGAGSQAAVRFIPSIDDQLHAIQIHIPYAADDVSAGQIFNLKVWEGGDKPQGDPIFSKDFIPQYGEGIVGFYTYDIGDPIPLTAGQSYFIGWEQVTIADSPIPIGMDKNNPDAASNNFFNLGVGWFPFPDNLPGALMIRAVVNGDPFVSNEPALNASEIAEIFPNPANDNLFINLKSNNYEDYQIGIFNSAGQLIHMSQLQAAIPVNTLANGMYFIQIKEHNTNAVYYEKFVKK